MWSVWPLYSSTDDSTGDIRGIHRAEESTPPTWAGSRSPSLLAYTLSPHSQRCKSSLAHFLMSRSPSDTGILSA